MEKLTARNKYFSSQKTAVFYTFLSRLRCQWYRFKSGIVIFAWSFTSNNAYSPFNSSFYPLVTYILTYSFAHSLAHLFTYLLTCLHILTYLLNYSLFTQLLTFNSGRNYFLIKIYIYVFLKYQSLYWPQII